MNYWPITLLLFAIALSVTPAKAVPERKNISISIGETYCENDCKTENGTKGELIHVSKSKNPNNIYNSSRTCLNSIYISKERFQGYYKCNYKQEQSEEAKVLFEFRFVEITAETLDQQLEVVDSKTSMENLTGTLSRVKPQNLSPKDMSEYSTLLQNISKKEELINGGSLSNILQFVDGYLNINDKEKFISQNITNKMSATVAKIARDFKPENGFYINKENNIKVKITSLNLVAFDSVLLDVANQDELTATEVIFSKFSIDSSNSSDKENVSVVVYGKGKLFPSSSGSVLSDVVEVSFISKKKGRALVDTNNPIKIRFIRPSFPHFSSCVFWDYSLNSFNGGWSSEGCRSTNSISSLKHILCECSHLTHFAILFHVDPLALAEHQEYLTAITKTGCIVSLICICVAFLTYILVRKWRTPPKKPLLHLCIALFITLFTFLIGFDRTDVPFLCISTAVILHYSILVVFMWLLAKVLLLYTCIVQGKPLTEIISQFLLVMSLTSWGLPFLSVVCTLAYDTGMYNGYEDFCWMDRDAFLYIFGIPLFCTIFMTFLFFTSVAVKVCRLKKECGLTDELITDLRYHIGMTFVLLLLTCFSWSCGFMMYWLKTSVTLAYIFSILGAFQGIFIFVFTVTADSTSRIFWKTFIYILIFGGSESQTSGTDVLIRS